MKNILVSCPDEAVCRTIRSCYNEDYRINCVASLSQTTQQLRGMRYDFVFIDLSVLCENTDTSHCKEALKPLCELHPSLDIVVMAPQEMTRKVVSVVKAGARDYLTYPINPEEVKLISESILDSNILQSELSYLRDQFWQSDSLELVQTRSPGMKAVFNKIRSVAPTRSSVLLLGRAKTTGGEFHGHGDTGGADKAAADSAGRNFSESRW